MNEQSSQVPNEVTHYSGYYLRPHDRVSLKLLSIKFKWLILSIKTNSVIRLFYQITFIQ